MSRTRLSLLAAALVAAGASSLAVALVLAGGGYTAPPPGIPDPGPVVSWGAPILRYLTDLAAVATIGWLLATAFLDPSGRDGVVSPLGRRDLVRGALAALVWACLAFTQMVFLLADVLGLTLAKTLDPMVLTTYLTEVPNTRALFATAVLALIVGAAAITTSTTGAAAAWLVVAVVAAALPSLAGHGAGLGDHALALSAGVAHVVAAVLWVGGLFALAVNAARSSVPLRRPIERFSGLALIAIILVAASGLANAYTRLETVDQLWTTGYGQVTLAKVWILLALATLGWFIRRRVLVSLDSTSRIRAFARVAAVEIVIMVLAISLGVALAMSPPPRVNVQFSSLGESLLGFAFPEAPTLANAVLGFRLEPVFLIGGLIAAGLYAYGYARLRARGDAWPIGRLISWMLGISLVIWATNSGISRYAMVSVEFHMYAHMTLAMIAPVLLVLGAPATLALRALKPAVGNERGPREWLTWFLHSWITGILTNPFYVFFVYVIGLYGLYLTPAFGWLMGSHLGHLFMETHFLISGYLFYWVMIGIDPRPKVVPYWGRLLMLLAALAIHGMFALTLMSDPRPLAPEWFSLVQPPWLTDPVADSLAGSNVAWGLAELPTLIVMIVIAIQWARSDDRESKRRDRKADRDGDAELAAYNAHLAQLADRANRRA